MDDKITNIEKQILQIKEILINQGKIEEIQHDYIMSRLEAIENQIGTSTSEELIEATPIEEEVKPSVELEGAILSSISQNASNDDN